MSVTAPSTVEINETSSAVSRTVTVPTIVNGDALILSVGIASGSATITITDNGLTHALTAVDTPASQSGHESQVFIVANLSSGDTGKIVTIATSSSVKVAGALTVLRGAATSSLVNAFQKKTAGSTTTPTTPSVVGTTAAAAVYTAVFQSRNANPNSTTADPNSGQGITELFDAFTVSASAASLSAGCGGLDASGLATGATYAAKTYTFDQAGVYSAWSIVLKPANVAPDVDAGDDQEVLSGDAVDLDGSATDPDGSVSGVLWTIEEYPTHYLGFPPTITNDTNLTTATFTPTQPGKYVVRLTATDNDGLDAYDEMIVWACTTTARAYAVLTDGGWTQYGAGADIPATLRDGSDTTGAQSASNPSGDTTVYALDPMPMGSKTVAGRANLDSVGTGSLTLTLKQGNGTTISTDTVTGLTGTTVVPFSLPLSTGENGTITDPHEMTLTVAASAST